MDPLWGTFIIADVFVFCFIHGVSHKCLDKVKPLKDSELLKSIIRFVFQKDDSIKWNKGQRISKLEAQETFRRLD